MQHKSWTSAGDTFWYVKLNHYRARPPTVFWFLSETVVKDIQIRVQLIWFTLWIKQWYTKRRVQIVKVSIFVYQYQYRMKILPRFPVNSRFQDHMSIKLIIDLPNSFWCTIMARSKSETINYIHLFVFSISSWFAHLC